MNYSWEKESLYVKVVSCIFAIIVCFALIGSLVFSFSINPIAGFKFLLILLACFGGLYIIRELYIRYYKFRIILSMLFLVFVEYLIYSIFGLIPAIVGCLFFVFCFIIRLNMQNKIVKSNEYKSYEKALLEYNFESAIFYLEQLLASKNLSHQHQIIVCDLYGIYVYLEQFDNAINILDKFNYLFNDEISKINFELLKLAMLIKAKKIKSDAVSSKLEAINTLINKIKVIQIKEFLNIQKLICEIRFNLNNNNIQEAINLLNKVPIGYKEINLYLIKAEIYEKEHNYKQAVSLYNELLKTNKDTLNLIIITKKIQACLVKMDSKNSDN